MRSGAGTNFGVVTVLPTNAMGTVVSGPVSGSGYQWYQVNMGSSGTGWVASDYLALVSGPGASATPTRTSVAPATATATATSTGGIGIGSNVRTTTSVNMRSGAGTNFPVIALLPTNANGSVIAGPSSGSGYQWFRLTVPGYGTGWVASDFLAVTSAPVATVTRTATSTSGFPTGSSVQVTEDLNMRNGPSTGNSVIAVLAAGTTCTVLGGPSSANGYLWYQLNCGSGQVGWAVSDWLSQVSSASLPEPSATAVDSSNIAATEPVTTEPAESTQAPIATETAETTETSTDESPVLPPVVETETSIPTEVVEVVEPTLASPESEQPVLVDTPTEIPAPEPQSLSIARIQRSEGSSAGQVLVDQNPSTVWMTDGSSVVPLAAFIADLDSPQYVRVLRWQNGDGGLAGTLHVSVSTDNENWTELTVDTIAAPGEWQELAIDASVQYVRFVFVNDDGLPAVGGIAELEIWP